MATYTPTLEIVDQGMTHRHGPAVQTVGCAWDMGTVALVTTSTMAGPYVPANARIVGVTLSATDCDTGTTLTLDVGDAGDPDRLVAAATIGRTGGATNALANAGIGYKYTTKTQINVIPHDAAAGAGTAQFIALKVDYIVE